MQPSGPAGRDDGRAGTDAERSVAEILDRFGRLDIVISCLGAAQGGVFWALQDHQWEEALDTKFMGMVRLFRTAIAPVRRAGYGRIIVIVGNNGRQPHLRMLPGSAENAACLATIKGLADEVAGEGIVVNALNPGPRRTSRGESMMNDLARQSGSSAAENEVEQLARMPMGRLGEADEMGRLVAFLSSDMVHMVTGTSLTTDGGASKALA